MEQSLKGEPFGSENTSNKRKINEPAHDKTYNKTCATSEDSGQPARPRTDQSSMIACAFYSLQTIQRGMNKNPCHTGWIYRLMCWSHRSYCRFCRALARITDNVLLILFMSSNVTCTATLFTSRSPGFGYILVSCTVKSIYIDFAYLE